MRDKVLDHDRLDRCDGCRFSAIGCPPGGSAVTSIPHRRVSDNIPSRDADPISSVDSSATPLLISDVHRIRVRAAREPWREREFACG